MTTTNTPERATARPWKRIRENAATALECLKSTRTVADARRYIQSVLDGIDTANALGELDQGGALTEAQIKHMVDRFLGWRLPEDFKPDAGISFERYDERFSSHRPKNEPTGTNLFDASQATTMVRYIAGSIEAVNTHDALQAENKRLRERVRELDTVRWAKLAAPNARICYGRRKCLNGETLFFGNEEMHWGIQLWTISSGVATDQSGNWEFLDAVEWWSYSLPPLPDALLNPQEPNNG